MVHPSGHHSRDSAKHASEFMAVAATKPSHHLRDGKVPQKAKIQEIEIDAAFGVDTMMPEDPTSASQKGFRTQRTNNMNANNGRLHSNTHSILKNTRNTS